jgi:hypothetical protein
LYNKSQAEVQQFLIPQVDKNNIFGVKLDTIQIFKTPNFASLLTRDAPRSAGAQDTTQGKLRDHYFLVKTTHIANGLS